MTVYERVQRNEVAAGFFSLDWLDSDPATAPKPIWSPFPDSPQERGYSSAADELFFGGGAGGGKALTLDTLIATPDGWKTMGELQVGDFVFDDQGCSARIVATSPVMHNHKVYAVHFDDGSIIKADADHRWHTFTYAERKERLRRTEEYRTKRQASRPSRSKGTRPLVIAMNKAREYKYLDAPAGGVRTTDEIIGTLKTANKKQANNHAVAVAQPLQLSDQSLLIPPYVLGLWLGDGTTTQGSITTSDKEVVAQLEAHGYTVTKRSSDKYGYGVLGLQVQLRKLGLLGHKHIPDQYLRASEDQRFALLQGLMDSDGTAGTVGSCTYSSISRELIDGVHELLLSLGIKCTVCTGRATLYGKDCGASYSIKFTTMKPVFRLPRKLKRIPTKLRGDQFWRYIVKVEPIDSEPVKCIAVDSPSHLYLAGRTMIPTHNTDMLLGLALTAHRKSIIFRRTYPELKEVIERSKSLLAEVSSASYNGQDHVWRNIPGGRILELGSIQYDDTLRSYQGRPHDLKGFDEISNFTEKQYRFLNGWKRTGVIGQRVRTVSTGNPPMNAEGEWVIQYWAAWLDPQHPNPALPGELRWYARVDDKDVEREDDTPFAWKDETITPKSRTFIPALVTDNPVYMATGYMSELQALPEPLRSQLLEGKFNVKREEDPWQCISAAHVQAAQRRHAEGTRPALKLRALGVDVARGGKDNTILAPLYGNWFDDLIKYPGVETPDGDSVAGKVMAAVTKAPNAFVFIDIVGVGYSPYDVLRKLLPTQTRGHNGGEKTTRIDKTGRFQFANKRTEAYWRMREALDPESGEELALPNDRKLLAGLCAPRWEVRGKVIHLETKEDVVARLGYSPDDADAVVMAWYGANFNSRKLIFA